jgi:type II secretory pathway pseudopilin PulG
MISRTTLCLFVLLASSMTTNVDAAAAAFTTGTGGKVNVKNNPASTDISNGSSSSINSSSPKTSTSSKTDLKAQATATPSASATASFSNLFGAKKSSGAASLQSSTLSSLNDLSLMLSRANEIATVAMDHAVPMLGDAYTSSFVSKDKNKDDKKGNQAHNSVQDEVDQYWLNPTIKYEGTTKVPCTNADRAVLALERLFPTYVKYSHAVVLAGNNSNSSHKSHNSHNKLENMNIPQPLAQALARAAAKANQKDAEMDALANAKQIIQEELADSSEASIDSVHLEILMDTLVPINNSKSANTNNNSKFQWYTGYLPEVGDVCLQINTFRPSSQSREQFEKDAKLISSMANFVNAFVKFIPSTPRSVSVDVDEKKKMEVNNEAKLTKFASPKSLKLLSLDENQAKIQNNVASRSGNDSTRPIVNLVNDFTDGILEELDAKVMDTTTTQEALELELELNSNSKTNTKVRSEVLSHLSTNNMIVSKIVTAKPKIEVKEEAAIADATMTMDAAMEKENNVENDMAMTMQENRTIASKRMRFPFQSMYFKKVFLAFLVLISRVVSLGQLELCFDE